ncbi:uncharacterized protein LOC143231351 [Tachypleus tridentatus]|uniref:uncharacterized protein LOC143231351 n=1 Tax=Tachypleus tridentatus TaxID=6853 RepID=UPI003FCF4E58
MSNFLIKNVIIQPLFKICSVELEFSILRITGVYNIGLLHKSNLDNLLKDKGIFHGVIYNARATWSTRMISHSNSEMALEGSEVQTDFKDITYRFNSVVTIGSRNQISKKVLDALGSTIIDKMETLLDDRMEEVISQVTGIPNQKVNTFKKGVPSVRAVLGSHLSANKSSLLSTRHHSIQKRQIPCQNGTDLDSYVDFLFRFTQRLLRNMEPFPLPNTTVWVEDTHTLVFLYNTTFRGITTISRRREPYVICRNTTDNTTITTLGFISHFDMLRGRGLYRVLQGYRTLLFNGDAEIKVSNSKIFVQLTQIEMANGDTTISVDRLRIWRLGKFRVLLRGLGNLTSALSMLITQQINQDPRSLIPLLEDQVKSMVDTMIQNVNIPIFTLAG